jgi:23S rRNA (uracil1939-C5)-methyltransferase
MDIVLASQSPRRRELLQKIAPEFRVVPSGVREDEFREKDPLRFALRAAEAKARDVGAKNPSSLIIAADTVVNLKEEILGKPKDRAEAEAMLRNLSGQRHRVITAIALYKKDRESLLTGYEISYVTFKTIGDAEIKAYLDKNEYLDKAGSYAVQEVGDAFVAKLEGDYENVVGFPVARVKKLLADFQGGGKVVSIEDVALPHDWGVGRIGEVVTFVPGTVPGDRVRVVVTKAKRRLRYGRIVEFEARSPFRVEPRCPHFGTCGGCTFQNLAYAKQLEIKEGYLLRTLQKIGGLSLDDVRREPISPSPGEYYYRGKMEYAFGSEGGRIFLGLRERVTPFERYKKSTVALRTCPIFSEAVEKIFPVLLGHVAGSGLDAYDPIARTGYWRNLVLREGKNTGEILAVLVTKKGKNIDLGNAVRELGERVPQLKSLWWVENERVSDLVDYAGKVHMAGTEFIEERLGERCFRIRPETFFQPNPEGAGVLYARIAAEVRTLGARKILGLFCGSGSIEIFVSGEADEVVGIDSEAPNISTARENVALNRIQNCRFLEGRVEDVLKEEAFAGFDLLVLDPPRAGLSPQGFNQIVGLGIPNLLYVSCNPAAFARDLGRLGAKGYRLRKLGCYDFFPQTPHLESMGILSRGN